METKQKIIELLTREEYSPMNIKELCMVFSVGKEEKNEFQKILDSLVREDEISLSRRGKYAYKGGEKLIKGKFQGTNKEFGFVIVEGEENDIFIPGKFVCGAMNGDTVLVKILKNERQGRRKEGKVKEVLERKHTKIVCNFEDSKNFGFAIPLDKRLNKDIFIPKAKKNGAQSGEVVVVNITFYGDVDKKPEGEVVEILGKQGDVGVDILTIVRKYGLPEEFSEKVENTVSRIKSEIPEKEYKIRKDLREKAIVTIDGSDAKDLDDAVSLEILENGNFLLGVHIADVTHYVREDDAIDKEAFERGTSVYLLSRVVPMLPKKLSNGLCSLNPNEDKLTLSCEMEINSDGKVINSDIFKSVIKSKHRLTYEDVTKLLKGDTEIIEKYKDIEELLKQMEKLATLLNKHRMKRGAIDFDFKESKITLSENGKPIDVCAYERGISNRIIEEFMLICNETVSEQMFWTNTPFIYRVHENPDPEKLDIFYEFVNNLGMDFKINKEVRPADLQEILKEVKGKNEENVVATLLLRSMMKARYTPESLGHFGLAAKYYSHFTSPIRRYPDLIIHRIIKEYIDGKIDEKRQTSLVKITSESSVQSSERERNAEMAERELDDLKKTEYMSDKIGEKFNGIISSVTSFGFFVALENTIEGLVHITELQDDNYVFDENRLMLIGENFKNAYKLGDEIEIEVVKADIEAREIFFALPNEIEE